MDIPFMQDVDDNFEWFIDYGVTQETLAMASGHVGRVHVPALLHDLFTEGLLGDDDWTAGLAAAAWCGAEYPDRALYPEAWRDLFEIRGYTVDSVLAERPAEPLTLYRGSHPDTQHHWSWTADRSIAEGFAAGRYGYRPPGGILWAATVEPWRLFAHMNARGEFEYVVDTDGLTIEEHR